MFVLTSFNPQINQLLFHPHLEIIRLIISTLREIRYRRKGQAYTVRVGEDEGGGVTEIELGRGVTKGG